MGGRKSFLCQLFQEYHEAEPARHDPGRVEELSEGEVIVGELDTHLVKFHMAYQLMHELAGNLEMKERDERRELLNLMLEHELRQEVGVPSDHGIGLRRDGGKLFIATI